MKDFNTDHALRDLRALVDHAREQYPHFESPRGAADILHAERAITTIEEFLAQQEMELFVECCNCGEDMYEVEGSSFSGSGSWKKYTCHDCHISVELHLEPQ